MFRILVSAVIVVVVALAGWSGFWQVMRDRLDDALDKRAARANLALSCSSRQITGYPFEIRFVCDDVKLTGIRGRQFELIAPKVTANTSVFAWRQMDIQITGPVKAEFVPQAEGETLGRRTTVQLHVAQVPVTAILRSARPADVSIRLESFRGRMTRWHNQQPVQSVRVSGGQFDGSLTADNNTDSAIIDLAGNGLTVRLDPPPADGFATTEVATATFSARADNASDLKGKTLAGRLRNWQGAGGRLRDLKFTANTDQLTLEGGGTAGLDRKGRVEARLSTGIAGFDRLLARLVELDVIDKNSAILVRATSDLLSERRAGDNGRWVRLPLRIKRGKVYFGPLPIGKLQRAF